MGAVPSREPSWSAAICAAWVYCSRVMMAGWSGVGDQIHWSGGRRRLPVLFPWARRFQTMCPVYLGLVRRSRTAESVQWPSAAPGMVAGEYLRDDGRAGGVEDQPGLGFAFAAFGWDGVLDAVGEVAVGWVADVPALAGVDL